ncbi:MAG TPA: hypothetical protein VLU25_05955 [Acidobacteriota bacterium]|nr:hypothetical protein [Acidobacteriota bacterium]
MKSQLTSRRLTPLKASGLRCGRWALALLLLSAQPLWGRQQPPLTPASCAAPASAEEPDSGQDVEQTKYLAAREITDLREFFLAQYYDVSRIELRQILYDKRHPRRPSRMRPDAFVDRFIDRRIDHYVEDLIKKMDEAKAALQAATDYSRTVRDNPARLREVRKPWREAFDTLAGRSDDLHDRLAMVFLPLDGGIDFDPETGRQDLDRGYAEQIQVIEANLTAGCKRIHDLLVEPTHVVEVTDLANNESILTYLQRAKRMSEHLREELKR